MSHRLEVAQIGVRAQARDEVAACLAHGIEDLRARIPAIADPVAYVQVGGIEAGSAGGDLLGVGIHPRVAFRQRVSRRRLHGVEPNGAAAFGGHHAQERHLQPALRALRGGTEEGVHAVGRLASLRQERAVEDPEGR
jgi:hypothetical protein